MAFAPDQVLVRFIAGTSQSVIDRCLGSAGAKATSRIADLNVLKLSVPTGSVQASISSLKSCPGIQYAEPNYTFWAADITPNDPDFSSQYGLQRINAPAGWALSTGFTSVVIAIVDTGVDLTHEDLAGKIVTGHNMITDTDNAQDDNGHGTHVAGIAAASTNNAIGIAGVSWRARIMPVKVLPASGPGDIDILASGITWAVDHSAKVINLSVATSVDSLTLHNAIDYAYSKNAVLVAAAGNNNNYCLNHNISHAVQYPAAYPHVIAVSATDSSNTLTCFSNFGPEIDVAAPGQDILSTFLSPLYRIDSGTSESAPFVSGLAAILAGFQGSELPDVITTEIESTALDLGIPGFDQFYGYGLIQMDAAIRSAIANLPTATPTLTPSPTQTTTPTLTPIPALAGVQRLPATGFRPHLPSILPAQPLDAKLSDLGSLWLEIPILNVKASIVGVPQSGDGWDVTWLGEDAGWLNGTAYPTHSGNSVISAHVYDALGRPGPFARLGSLVWGDPVILHAFGQEYIYSVRDKLTVTPSSIAIVMKHEALPWLTLLTCKDYDVVDNSYREREIVRAVLVQIK